MNQNRDILVVQAIKLFREKFHCDPDVAVFAPGRANLIGEHTDYNDGFVLPFALPYKTVIVAARSNSKLSKVVSGEFPSELVEFAIDENLAKGEPTWANYVKGTVFQYLSDLPKGSGFFAAIVSNVPLGSGLSSSAALEVSTATMLEALYNIDIEGVNKALRCQKAEHTFADTPCGIMDQYISSLGKEGNLLLIDCRTTSFNLVPFGEGDDVPIILVTNSNVKHKLSGSEYPDRVRQCKEAVTALQIKYPSVKALRDASEEMLENVKGEMSDVCYRRARHVIGENARTLATVEALTNKDFVVAGEYMTQSHESLRDDYEVSCEELDFLVRSALSVKGVYGSRMTGGGFGGCTVTLVEKTAAKELERFLHENYFKQYHNRCECYEAVPSSGASILEVADYLRFEKISNAGAESEKIPAYAQETVKPVEASPKPSVSKSVDVEKEKSRNSGFSHYILPTIVVGLAVAIGVSFIWKKR